jgi:3-hydroxymyristoyl/3-hydroxydecanoyl-(acyl carrier protein) dehydratase
MCYWEVQVACLIENLARCIVQSALIAVTNVKFRSNLIPADQSIVEIVGQKEDEHVVSVTSNLRERIVSTFFIFHIF